MSKNIVLIDADSLCYLGKADDTLQQIIEKVDYKIHAILDETKADYYVLFISKGQYFRHNLKTKSEDSGSYKANRTYTGQKYAWAIKEYLIAQYNAQYYLGAEADDAIAYWMNKSIGIAPEDDEKSIEVWEILESAKSFLKEEGEDYYIEECNLILASIDKDLLQSIPGKHLNYNKKIGPDEWNTEWVETTLEESLKFKAMQMLHGDASDGINCLGGIGPKRAEKILELWTDSSIEAFLLEMYLNYYNNSAEAIYEFQKNYRMLHLLESNEDWLREVGYVPELPVFQKVERIEEVEIKTEF